MKKQLGIYIPGRLNSERLPNKLILRLGGSCLWDIACNKLNQLPERYNKYVLCYDKELIEIAKKYENIKIIIRDKSTIEAEGPMSYIFKDLKNTPDTHLMFLNPCLSLLSLNTIKMSINLFELSSSDCGTSVKPFKNWIFNETGNPVTDINFERLSTKEIKGYYQAAHCFHIFNKDRLFNGDGLVLDEKLLPLPVPEEETMDIDTYEDYLYAKWRFEQMRKQEYLELEKNMIRNGAKKHVIDIDNTICLTPEGVDPLDYTSRIPDKYMIDMFNSYYDNGDIVVYSTARGYVTGEDHYLLTKSQLDKWGAKYHYLICGEKPNADYYYDDKGVNLWKD